MAENEKKVKTRISLRHDLKNNWDNVPTFIPNVAEPIFYENKNRMKIGDGVTELSKLKNYTGAWIHDGSGENAIIVNDLTNNIAEGKGSFASGLYTKASNTAAHAEGYYTEASGLYSHAEGAVGQKGDGESIKTTASGQGSHAEGMGTQATNTGAHSEGTFTIASEIGAHAEGRTTVASSNASHAEGYLTEAIAPYSHAEGFHTLARNAYAHASGLYTKTSRDAQTVVGQYNEDDTQAMFIVGGGTSNANKTVFKVGQNGDSIIRRNLVIDSQGNLIIGQTSVNESQLKKMLTSYPVKGVDYFTEADKEEMVADVISSLNEVSYTNLLPTALDYTDISKVLTGEDGSVGYLNNRRISSSGAYASASGWDVTGLISAKPGDIVYLHNVTFQHYVDYPNGNHGGIGLYDKDGAYVTSWSLAVSSEDQLTSSGSNFKEVYDGLNIIQFTVPNWGSNIKYVVVTCQDINEKSIITVNEPIVLNADTRITELKAEVNDIAARVSQIENTDYGSDLIPSYWQTALDEGVEEINTALCEAGRNKSAFLFYSDAHWNYGSQMSPKLLKYLYEHTGMTKTFYGGDIVNNESSDYDTMKYLWEWRNMLKGVPNHHSVVGNHDDGNATNNLFSEEYVYGYLLAAEETPDIVRGDSGLYYYIDNGAEKTRYIFLDTAYKAFLADQEEWLKETLISTKAGWHIVLIAHIWYGPDYGSSIRPIPIAGLSPEAARVTAMLDKYNSRSEDFVNCGGRVEFCIGGHCHIDYAGATETGIPIILVETDSRHIRGSYDYTLGTTTESSVNGIIADYTAQTVNVVRIGRGNSFTVDLNTAETKTYYSVTFNLTNVEATNMSNKAEQYETYFTTITPIIGKIKSVTVTMGGVDVTSDSYDAPSGEINVTNVNGDIVITAIAGETPTDDPDEPTYTNVLATAIDTDGNIYNGVGWQADREVSTTSYAERDASNGWDLTGYIKVHHGDIIRLKNITMPDNVTDRNNMCYIYNADMSWKGCNHITSSNTAAEPVFENGNLVQFKWYLNYNEADGGYIRLNATKIDKTSIITINEPIQDNDSDEIVNLLDTVGYTDGMRLKTSSGELVEKEGYVVSGFIRLEAEGDVYRTSGINFNADVEYDRGICCYDAAVEETYWMFVPCYKSSSPITLSGDMGTVEIDDDGNLIYTVGSGFNVGSYESGVNRGIRFSGYGSGADAVITLNQDNEVSYTNVIPLSINKDGTPFAGGKGWMANSRIGSNGIYAGDQPAGTDEAQWVTGHIEIDPTIDNIIRLKNVTFDSTSTNSRHGVAFFDASFARIPIGLADATNNWLNISAFVSNSYGLSAVLDGTNIVQFTLSASTALYEGVKYFAICCGGLSDDSIITINEPIDNESPVYTNVIPLSINADGTQYVGENGEDGYKVGYRINSSGNETASEGFKCTGFIPVKLNDVVYLKNIAFSPTGGSGTHKIQVYDASFGSINGIKEDSFNDMQYLIKPYEVDEATGYLKSFTVSNSGSGYSYIRVVSSVLDANSIITINEPIE